jgi:hypothetical protein
MTLPFMACSNQHCVISFFLKGLWSQFWYFKFIWRCFRLGFGLNSSNLKTIWFHHSSSSIFFKIQKLLGPIQNLGLVPCTCSILHNALYRYKTQQGIKVIFHYEVQLLKKNSTCLLNKPIHVFNFSFMVLILVPNLRKD